MAIKEELPEVLKQLNEKASWEDFIKELYRQKKITVGMTKAEISKSQLDESDLNTIIGRLSSAKSQPSDMRDTKEYTPGNATTIGMIGGIVAILFSFVFPPIAWIGGGIAVIGGLMGLKNQEQKAWVPILLAIISLIPFLVIFNS